MHLKIYVSSVWYEDSLSPVKKCCIVLTYILLLFHVRNLSGGKCSFLQNGMLTDKQTGILHLTYRIILASYEAGYMCWSNLLFVICFITFIHFPFCTFVLGSLLLWSLYSHLRWPFWHLCTVSDLYITVLPNFVLNVMIVSAYETFVHEDTGWLECLWHWYRLIKTILFTGCKLILV